MIVLSLSWVKLTKEIIVKSNHWLLIVDKNPFHITSRATSQQPLDRAGTRVGQTNRHLRAPEQPGKMWGLGAL